MYRLLLVLLFTASINAEVYDGVAIVVKDKAITLYDIENEMKLSHLDAAKAADVLIRNNSKHLKFKSEKSQLLVVKFMMT